MASAVLGKTLIQLRLAATLTPSYRHIVSKPWKPSSFCYSSLGGAASSLPAGSALRSLAAMPGILRIRDSGIRFFATRPTTSSLNDPSPNWSNRPPKETILLDGCDFEHWLCVMEPPEGNPTRDEIIDSYIKTLAQIVGSEEEARKKIYSVSTKHYYAFGALVSEELSYKIKELPRVRWVLPDSYLDVKNKDYGGEPFIDGKAVPYDPKYHEEWVRNNARANERSRRNDRPRNFDRSRNFERRRENMQNRDFQSRDMPPMPNRDFQGPPGAQNPTPAEQPGNLPNNNFQGNVPNNNFQSSVPNPNFQGNMPSNNFQGNFPNNNFQRNMPNNNFQAGQPGNLPNNNFQGNVPNNNFQSSVPNPNFQGNMPNNNFQGNFPNNNFQRNISNNNFQGNMPNNNFQGNVPNNNLQGNMGGGNFANREYQTREFQSGVFQGNSSPDTGYQGNNMPNRDTSTSSNGNYPPIP